MIYPAIWNPLLTRTWSYMYITEGCGAYLYEHTKKFNLPHRRRVEVWVRLHPWEYIVYKLFVNTWLHVSCCCRWIHWSYDGNLLWPLPSHMPKSSRHQNDLNSFWHVLFGLHCCSSINSDSACFSVISWSTSEEMKTWDSFCLSGRQPCQSWSSSRHTDPVYTLGEQDGH